MEEGEICADLLPNVFQKEEDPHIRKLRTLNLSRCEDNTINQSPKPRQC